MSLNPSLEDKHRHTFGRLTQTRQELLPRGLPNYPQPFSFSVHGRGKKEALKTSSLKTMVINAGLLPVMA